MEQGNRPGTYVNSFVSANRFSELGEGVGSWDGDCRAA